MHMSSINQTIILGCQTVDKKDVKFVECRVYKVSSLLEKPSVVEPPYNVCRDIR